MEIQLPLAIGGRNRLGGRQVEDPLPPRQLLANRPKGRNRQKPVREPDEATCAMRDKGACGRRGSVCGHLSPLEHRVLSHDRVEHVALNDGKRGEKYAAEHGRSGDDVCDATARG